MKGRIICFTGTDGVGKTTHALKCSKWLTKKRISFQYCKIHNYFILIHFVIRHISRIFGFSLENFNKTLPARSLWIGLVMGVYVPLVTLRVELNKVLGNIVLCDRYVYDGVIYLLYHRIINIRMAWIILHMALKPDLTILLNAKTTLLQQRKPSHDFHYFTYQKILYSYLSRTLGFITVETNRSIETVEKEVVASISRLIAS
jgi:thymidylate kinase